MKTEIPYPKFLNEKPLGKDLFIGGSHDIIAKSIAKYISLNYSERKLIGIDGSWGSGKSNVIEILKKSYLKDSHKIFIYDTWGHQEDLQRRALLEELTEYLINEKCLPCNTTFKLLNGDEKNGTWKERLTYLLARKKNTFQQVTPRLSKGLIISILVTVFTPIAKTISTTIENDRCLSILITSLPLIIGILFSAYFLIFSKKQNRWSTFINIYKESEQTKDISEIVSESEPSVNEFRAWIKSISDGLSNTKAPKKLIIVYDNLDRLPPEKVKAIWSSIHTFFAECDYKNIWVLVPFDRKHIKDAFLENDKDFEKTNHFINKTFSAIFRIPPPILTDWHDFFKNKYNEAFNNTEQEEFYIVKSIFDLTNKEITPRNIILFINNLVSEKQIENNSVKLRYIALFIAFKKEILLNPIDEILKPSFVDKIEYLFKGDYDLSDNIASLVYNLPIDSARQITLTQDLRKSLDESDTKRVNEYANQKHFIEMLEKVVFQEQINIKNTVLTIDSINKDTIKLIDENKLLVIWDALYGKLQSSSLKSQEFSNAHKILLQNISAHKRESFISYLVREISNFDEFSGENFAKAIKEIELFLQANKMNINVYSFIQPKVTSPSVLLSCVKVYKNSYNELKISTDESELIKYIEEKVPNELNDLDIVGYLNDKYDLSSIVLKIEQCISNDEVTLDNLSTFFNFYKEITDNRPIKFCADQTIHLLLKQAKPNTNAYYELVSMRLAKGDKFNPQFNTGVCLNILTNNESSLIPQIASRIEIYRDTDDLIEDCLRWEQPIIISTLKHIITVKSDNSSLLLEKVLPISWKLKDVLNIEYPKIIDFLNDWHESASSSINTENINVIIPFSEFFENAVIVENELTKILIQIFIEHLNSVTVETWYDSLIKEDSYYINSLYFLVAGAKIKNLPENVTSAYKNILVNLAKEEIKIIHSAKNDYITKRINKNSLKSTIKDIRDHFINNKDISPELFMFFFNMFIEHGKLNERPNDVTRRILTPVVNDENCLLFMIEHREYVSTIVNKSDEDSVNIRDHIRLKVESGSSIENLNDFAEKIKAFNKKETEEN